MVRFYQVYVHLHTSLSWVIIRQFLYRYLPKHCVDKGLQPFLIIGMWKTVTMLRAAMYTFSFSRYLEKRIWIYSSVCIRIWGQANLGWALHDWTGHDESGSVFANVTILSWLTVTDFDPNSRSYLSVRSLVSSIKKSPHNAGPALCNQRFWTYMSLMVWLRQQNYR